MSLLLAVTLLHPVLECPTGGPTLAPARSPVVASADGPGFPPASEDLVLPAGTEGDSWTYLDLLVEYGRLTGQHVRVSAETHNFLQNTHLGLLRSVVVPKAEVQGYVEGLLHEGDYVLQVVRPRAPRLLRVTSLQTGARTGIRSSAPFVPEEELDAWADHPAMLIETVVHLPNVDVRQLSNSMRTMITDANTRQMLPAGDTHTMVLVGFASEVVELADMLRRMDVAAGREVPEPSLRRFALANAAAADVAGPIQDLLRAGRRQRQGGEPHPAGPVEPPPTTRVIADPRTNALVVTCPSGDLERVAELVELFDVKQED